MRLICPNCDAAYEVPDSVIPVDGRDVQCSDCGQTWFQHHPDHMPEPEPEPEPEPDETDDASEVRLPRALADRAKRAVPDDVRDILREEAERESRARQAEALETQPELGLTGGAAPPPDPEDRRVREAKTRMARLRGEDPRDVVGPSGTRKEMLPDIEEINSTLRATSERSRTAVDYGENGSAAPLRKRGFWSGFGLIVVVVAVLLMIYVFAPQIARVVPGADPLLSQYVGLMDGFRAWFNDNLSGLSAWLEQVAAGGGEDGA